MNYGFHAFVPQRVIDARQPVPPLPVNGVRVPVVAERALTSWVWAENADRPAIVEHLRTFQPPLRDGEVVGTVTATMRGLVLGRVPLVVANAPPADQQLPPTEAGSGPVWRRSIDAVNGAANALFHAVFG